MCLYRFDCMSEAAASGPTPVNKLRGIGAQAGSDRREYRKFKPKPKKPSPISEVTVDGSAVDGDSGKPAAGTKPIRKRKPRKLPPCKFFNSPEGCRMGDECRFPHTASNVEVIQPPTVAEGRDSPPAVAAVAPVFVPPNLKTVATIPVKRTLHKADSGTESQMKARNEELAYLKRRFLKPKCTTLDESDCVEFKYEVTEPDWVFDIRFIIYRITIMKNHPIDAPRITVPSAENSDMPEVLRSHIEKTTSEAIKAKFLSFEERDSFEVIGKLLIRWIDRNVLTMFVEGLKRLRLVFGAYAAGISLVAPTVTATQDNDKGAEEDQDDEVEYGNGEGTDSEDSDDDGDESSSAEENGATDVAKGIQCISLDPREGNPAIEVVLIWTDQCRNIASIVPTLLHISSKCGRCTQEHSRDVPTNGRPVAWRCIRCGHAQSVLVRSQLVHENSSILGMMDARGCRPLDCVLLQSAMKYVCLACNKEDDVQKLNFGQSHKSWCRNCHAACEFCVTAIRFRGDFTGVSAEDADAAKKLPKPKKKVEVRSAVTPGGPLPDRGTCKHYKKSYRWFRFPCCGKLFPCDICHAESGFEHETKQANRMVCGHCSTEQMYMKNKPCTNCDQAVTRTRSQFWEGGKGCRDQNKMNRNDAKKFSGSRQKTVNKKKTGQLATKNKK